MQTMEQVHAFVHLVDKADLLNAVEAIMSAAHFRFFLCRVTR